MFKLSNLTSSNNNKYIREDRKIKYLSNVIEGNESNKLCKEILSISKEQIPNVYNKIIKFGRVQYFVNFIQNSIKIRPGNANNFLSLLALILSNENYSFDKEGYMGDLLAYVGLISKELEDGKNSIEKILYNFEENSIEEAILKDDAEKFAKCIIKPDFDPKGRVAVKSNTLLEFVMQSIKSDRNSLSLLGRSTKSRNIEYTYMQLIAFFGSVRCFKVGISNGSLEKDDLHHFSIAGGNREIIKILEQRGVSFDDCFEIATTFHQYDISDWLLNNYKCEYDDSGLGGSKSLSNALKSYNDAVFLFLSKNGYGNMSLRYTSWRNSVEAFKHLIEDKGASVKEKFGKFGLTSLHIASMKGNIDSVRYLVEVCAANILEKEDNGNIALDFANGNAKGAPWGYGPEEKRKQVKEYLEEKMNK